MGHPLYNLIIQGNPKSLSADSGQFSFPKDQFLKLTEDSHRKQFDELTPKTIKALKKMPTLFATANESSNTRIGKITEILVNDDSFDIHYEFDSKYYPLVQGTLDKFSHALGIQDHLVEFFMPHWEIKEGDIFAFYEMYLTSLPGIAQQLQASDKKVQLIYAFNGTGKTLLSREFKRIVDQEDTGINEEYPDETLVNILYYNAFTEDLFYWNNEIDFPELQIQPNTFTDWILRDRGQDQNIIAHFQRYTSDKLTPYFVESVKQIDQNHKPAKLKTYPRVFFSLRDYSVARVKISKGEESNFIWSVFFALLTEAIEILNETENRDKIFNNLQYVFIDDPVSSLDDTHLIELAVDLAQLILSAPDSLKFIITTHNPLFFNVLQNELSCNIKDEDKGKDYKYQRDLKTNILYKFEDGSFDLKTQPDDSSFSYHLHLLSILRQTIVNTENIQKYHFGFLRNILEKTATFLGHKGWGDLVPVKAEDDRTDYIRRILNHSSHSRHAGDETALVSDKDKDVLIELVDSISTKFNFKAPSSKAN